MRLTDFELAIQVLLEESSAVLLHVSGFAQAVVDVLFDQILRINTASNALFSFI